LTITDGNLPNTRNILNLDAGLTNFILNGIRLFLIFLTLYFLKWPPFKKTESQMHQLWEVCYILLLIPLIFPHQQKYAFLMVLPAQFYLACVLIFVYPVHKIIMSRLKWNSIIISVALSFALMTLSTDGLVGRDLNKLSQHYKTITYGTLLLILPLMLSSDRLFARAKSFRDTKIPE